MMYIYVVVILKVHTVLVVLQSIELKMSQRRALSAHHILIV